MSTPGIPVPSTPGTQGGDPPPVINEESTDEQRPPPSTAVSESVGESGNAPTVDEGNQNKEPSSDMTEKDQTEQRDPASDPSGSPAVASASKPENVPQEESIRGRMKALSISTDVGPSPPSGDQAPPPPPEKDNLHVNPSSGSPRRPSSPATSEWADKELPNIPGGGGLGEKQDEKQDKNNNSDGDDVRDDGSQSEIQSIMEQFADPSRNNDQGEIMSPRLELAGQFLGGPNQYPPRKSSLEHMKTGPSGPGTAADPSSSTEAQVPGEKDRSAANEGQATPQPGLNRSASTSTIPPPPAPEPDQPFDFHRFLEQLRHRTADPVAKFLRSFLMEFGKRQWMVHEQVKIISDFLAFITNKMAQCEVWRDVSDSEFDNAKEGMEKLVMNRLYSQTFSPMIPAPPSVPRSTSRSKRRELERRHGPWRRGQHQEDIERDEVLAQKIRIYSWVKEEHLDIPPVGHNGRRFLALAQQGEELMLFDVPRFFTHSGLQSF